MSEPPPEEPLPPNEALEDALLAFTGCVGEAVDICSYGLTIGEAYVPFDPDEDDNCDDEDDGVQCSQLWVRVMAVTPTDINEQSFEAGGCGSTLAIDIEVGILRCLEIPDGGNAPTASDVLVASMQAVADMKAIYCAAMSCEEAGWDSIEAGQWTPSGPLGGQYGGIWTFTVEMV